MGGQSDSDFLRAAHDFEQDVSRDSVTTIYLNKPAPTGGLKVTYWEIAEER